ncbi:MAG: dicarboxylate/amino acid:cation symporter [Polynucleobacter sp. 24-46-87]|jgi:Na+/H+-dicarboxylate symporter|nr:MAG: dicarboxylate/amino acid:cation symporter [Polynucleobacter sp. 35-46-207]OYZ36162.1 MAG: dicarboxylate/amino acid:cation symporter [Polynucleobacter sp. 16-46-70]OZA10305.1 MAG: dicarboxylate/amino acid:cation symporter [Polynucleobacter sp. 24-46-87]OZA36641.1 MAG: dicarboxylate/amino acid:cation symporter [Polynucleobacter sp. 17-46-58]HQR83931.1 dicarboxylate/amino acid:cation symporter [Polynucleobacter sp.]
MTSKKLTHFILAAMILGIVGGYLIHQFGAESGLSKQYVSYVSLLTDIFLRLIKMIIAPLVFTTLVVGISRMGDASTIGRIGLKTFSWFIAMSTVSLLLGLFMVNLLDPGVGVNLPIPELGSSTGLSKGGFDLTQFVQHIFPTSIVEAMAKNEILQIVVFAVFFGVAAGGMGSRAEELIRNLDMLSNIMLRITTAVMKFAPVAVFAAVSTVIAENGVGILMTYGKFMLSFYGSILILWLVIVLISALVLKSRVFELVSMLRQPVLLAFSTASSEAAYPMTLEQVERFGCKKKIASFVLPVGYSFNLDGSMMYCSFATIFIAQVYSIEMELSQQLLMLLVLMVTSKGIAGVPRASLVVIAATLSQFNLPEAGVLLILGVDHFLDMARSATNVLGNGLATAVISKWEGELEPHHSSQ